MTTVLPDWFRRFGSNFQGGPSGVMRNPATGRVYQRGQPSYEGGPDPTGFPKPPLGASPQFASPLNSPQNPGGVMPYGVGMQMPGGGQPSPDWMTAPGSGGPIVGNPPPAQGPEQGPPQPPAPPTRPSPALAAFRASVGPQGGLGAVPMPPERPAGLGTPQVPAANPWDAYNQSGNAADFVRANEAMGRSPQGAATNLNLGGGPMGGPGSWMPTVSRFGDLIDKDSVAGKLMQMANPRQRPGPQAAPEGLLPKLFGMWGQGQGAMAPQVQDAGMMTPQWDYNPPQAQADNWS